MKAYMYKFALWLFCLSVPALCGLAQEQPSAKKGQAAVDTRPRVGAGGKSAVSVQPGGSNMPVFVNGIIWNNFRNDGVAVDRPGQGVSFSSTLWYADPQFEEIPGFSALHGFSGFLLPSHPDALDKGDLSHFDLIADSLDLLGNLRRMCLPDYGAFERQDVSLPALTVAGVAPVCEGALVARIDYTDVQNSPNAWSVHFPGEWAGSDVNGTSLFNGDPIQFRIPAGMPVGRYDCLLVVRGGAGCESEYPFVLEIRPVVTPEAVLSLAGASVLCRGEKARLKVSFTGEGPYDYRLADEAWVRTFSGRDALGAVLADTVIEVAVSSDTEFRLASVLQSSGCGGKGRVSGIAVVKVLSLPEVSLAAAAAVCEDELTPLVLRFTGEAPFVYRINGMDEQVAGGPEDTLWVGSGTYVVSALNAGGCAFDASQAEAVSIRGNSRPAFGAWAQTEVTGDAGAYLVTAGMPAPDAGSKTIVIEAPAVISEGAVLAGGWLLDGKPVSLPYKVMDTDRGKLLMYSATNDCGTSVTSDGIRIQTSSKLPALTVNGTQVVKSRVYDGTTVAEAVCGELGGVFAAAPDVQVAVEASYMTPAVGKGKTIFVRYILSGADRGKYRVPDSYTLPDGEITCRPLRVDGNAVSDKYYDGTPYAVMSPGALQNVVAGDTVGLELSAVYSRKDAGSGLKVTVNSVRLVGPQSGNYLAPELPAEWTGSILRKPLTVTGTKVVTEKAWDDTPVAAVTEAGTLSGVVSGEVVGLRASAVYDQSEPGTDIRIRVDYTLTGEAGVLANYVAPSYDDSFRGAIYRAPSIGKITAPEAVCAGGTIVLNDPQVDDPRGEVVRSWWSLDGVELATRTPQLSAEDDGKLLRFNIQTPDVVSSSNEVAVTVYPLPAVRLSGGGSICAPGDQAIVKVEFTSGSAPFRWHLNGEEGVRILADTNVAWLTVAPAGLTTYRVTSVSDARGCVATELGNAAVVSPGERPTAVISGGGTVCAGGSAVVKVEFTGPAPYYYRLTGDVTDRMATSPTVWATVTPPADPSGLNVYTARYQVETLEADGCLADVGEDLRGEAAVTVNNVVAGELSGILRVARDEEIAPDAPEVKGNYTGGYWYLNGKEISMPYKVKASDNGAWLTYRVMNSCGEEVESAGYLKLEVTDGLPVLAVTGTQVVREKEYDGTVAAQVTAAGTLTGLAAGEMVTVDATAAFMNASAGVGKTIWVYYSLSGADAGKYAAPRPVNLDGGLIRPKQLVIGAPVVRDKVYDGSIAAEVMAGKPEGVVSAEEGNLDVFAQGIFDSKTVGRRTVNISYTLTGTGVGNYLPPVAGTATAEITPRDIRVVGTEVATAKIYDGRRDAVVITKGRTEGEVAGDVVDFSVSALYDVADAGTGRTITVSYAPLAPGDALNYRWPADYTLADAVITGLPQVGEISDPGAQCAGASINLPAPVLHGNGGVLADNGHWLLNDTEIQMPYTLGVGDSGKVLKYKVQNEAGVAYSNEVVLTVHALPEVALTGDTICSAGEIARLKLNFSGEAPFTYALSDGTTGRLDTGTAAVAEVMPAATTVYHVTRLGDARCQVEDVRASAVVNVGTRPAAEISGNMRICAGSEAVLRIRFSGEAPFTYRISGDTAGRFAETAEAVVKVSPEVTTVYTLQSAATAGCVVAPEALTGEACVTVDETPEVTVSGDVTLCSGEPAELSLHFTGGTGEYVYRLSGDTEDRYFAGTEARVAVNPEATTVYTVDTLGSGVCGGRRGSGSATVTRPALPTVGRLEEPADFTLPATLEVAEPATANAVRGCWLLDNDTVDMPYVLKDTDNGKKLRYVAWNGCGDRAESNRVTVNIPASPVRVLAVRGTELETVRTYNGGLSVKVLAVGELTPEPAGEVILSAEARFIGSPYIGNKKIELVYRLSGSDAAGYMVQQPDGLLDGRIIPLPLEMSEPVVVKTKVYDGTAEVVPAVLGGTPLNLAGSDTLRVETLAAYSTHTAGENRKITVNYTLSGLLSVNYAQPEDFTVTDAVITPKPLTTDVPLLVKNKTYDGLRDAEVLAGRLNGLVGGDEVLLSASALYDNRNAGVNKALTVRYALDGRDCGNYIQPVDYTVADGEIRRLQLGVEGTEVAFEKGYDGTAAAQVLNPGRLTNAVYSDSIELKVRAEYDSPEIGRGKEIRVDYLLTGVHAGNYIAPAGYRLTDGVISKCPEVALPVVPALCAGNWLEVARPAVAWNGSVQEGSGWWTLDNEVVDMPYAVSAADNGRGLKYHIRTQACGVVSSEAVELKVYGLPAALLEGVQTICGGTGSGEKPDFKLTVMGGTAPYTYRLSGDVTDMILPEEGVNTIRVSRPQYTSRYEVLWLKDARGCAATDISGEASVKVVPLSGVTLSGGGQICEGEAATLVVSFTGEAPFTYAINGGEEHTTYARREEIAVTPLTDTEYRVTMLKSGEDCAVGQAALAGAVANVRVSRKPQVGELAFDACLDAGQVVNVNMTVADVLRQGWTLDGEAVNMPLTVALTDHGKILRFRAENRCGSTESNGVQLLVKGNTDKLLRVEGVQVEEKTYDGTTAGVADLSGVRIYAQGVNAGNCSLTTEEEVTAAFLDKLTPAVRFDNVHAGNGHRVIVSWTLAEEVAGYVAPRDNEILDGVILRRTVTVDEPLLAASRPYDATTRAAVTAGRISSGVVPGDEVQVTAAAAYRDKHVGAAKPVDVKYTLGGRSAGDYALAAGLRTEYTAAITALPLTVVGEEIRPGRLYREGDRTAEVIRQGVPGGVIAGDEVRVNTRALYDSDTVGLRTITVSFEQDATAADAQNYKLPASYRMSGVIYDKPEYTTPLEGIADRLCLGSVVTPRIPGYRLKEAPLVSAGWTITRNGVSSPFEVPYRVGAGDDGAVVRYVVRNTAGYAEDADGVNRVVLNVGDKPAVERTLAALPAMEQMTGLQLPATAPAVSGAVTAQGWALVTRDQDIATATKLELPYTVKLKDNGKYLVYWAENGCGRSESNRVALNVYKAYPVELAVKVVYVQTRKRYDGTAAIAEEVIFTVGGIESGHEVALVPEAFYDSPEPGENKRITIRFTLTGADAGKYAPVADVVRHDGMIYNLPAIEALPVPDALCAGTWLNVPEPVIRDNAAPIMKKGWSLDGVTIPMPYRVEAADSAKVLTFWAVNTVGVTETAGVEVTVKDKPSVALLDVEAFRLNLGDTLRGLPEPVVRDHGYEVTAAAWYINGQLLEMPYHVTISDLGAKLAYHAVNACGETEGAEVPVKLILTTGAPLIAALPVPGYICAGDTLNMEIPAVDPHQTDTIVNQGWKLNGEMVRLPLQLDVTDNGSLLTYFAANEYGTSETEPVMVTVRPRPSVTMPADTVIHVNGQATVVYGFSGTSPFTYILKDGQTGTTSPGQGSYIELVAPEHACYYGVNALSDAYCTAWPLDLADSMLVRINDDKIRIMTGDTVFVYDGEFKQLEVLADPADRTDSLKVYYDGSTARPYLPGIYPTVVKFGGDWQFGPQEKHVTVIIEKAYAEVLLENLNHIYDGLPKEAEIITDPDGLNLHVTYNDTTLLPVASGRYRVHAEVVEGLWQGAADGLLVIGEYTDKAEMINTIEVRENNNTKFLVKDIERYTDVRVMIFDKSGALVYKSEDYYNDYDMRDLRAGTYYYVLKYRNEGREETRRGAVTVIK